MSERERRQVAVKKTNVVAVEKHFFRLRLPAMDDRTQKLLRLIIAKIDDKRDEKIPWLVFELTEIFELLGIENDNNRWTKIREELKKLKHADVVIPAEFFKPGMWDEALQDYLGDEEVEETLGFIRGYRTYKHRGMFAVLLEKTMIPFLLDVKKFQKYQIGEILNFRKDYTIRFYEWFISAKDNTSKSGMWLYNITVKEIRRRLDLDHANGKPKKHAQYRELKRKVIIPSCDEIGANSSFTVDIEEIKRKGSRAVTSIVFHCKPKESTKVKNVSTPARSNKTTAQKFHEDKERRYTQLWKLYEKYGKNDEDLIAAYQTVEGETIRGYQKTRLASDTIEQLSREAALDAIEDALMIRQAKERSHVD